MVRKFPWHQGAQDPNLMCFSIEAEVDKLVQTLMGWGARKTYRTCFVGEWHDWWPVRKKGVCYGVVALFFLAHEVTLASLAKVTQIGGDTGCVTYSRFMAEMIAAKKAGKCLGGSLPQNVYCRWFPPKNHQIFTGQFAIFFLSRGPSCCCCCCWIWKNPQADNDEVLCLGREWFWQTFLDGCPADFGALSCEVTSISPHFRKLVGWWNNSSIQIRCSPAAGKHLRWRMFKELDVDNNNSLDANEIRAPCLHLWALNQKYVREMSLEIFRVYKHENKKVVLLEVHLCFAFRSQI